MFRATETGGNLILLTWVPERPGPAQRIAAEAWGEIGSWLTENGAVLLQERVFGRLESAPCVFGAWDGAGSLSRLVRPTYVEGTPVGPGGLAGIHAVAARAAGPPRAIERAGRICGVEVNTASATFLSLPDVGKLLRNRARLPREEEVAETLDLAAECLATVGWSFGEVVRTWFYLRDILDWYRAFNQVRNRAYQRFGLLKADGANGIPASTGIAGRNAAGGWCALDLLAVRARPGHPLSTRRLHNRRQGEATAYGSSFARGVVVEGGGSRCIFASGTASIDERGASVHLGDFDAQVRRTLDVLEALLDEEGATLRDIRQATVFLKDPTDARAFERIAQRTGLLEIPAVCTVADVCREELLFELDAAAVVRTAAESPTRAPAA